MWTRKGHSNGVEPRGIGEGISNDEGNRINLSRLRNRKGNGWKAGSLWLADQGKVSCLVWPRRGSERDVKLEGWF